MVRLIASDFGIGRDENNGVPGDDFDRPVGPVRDPGERRQRFALGARAQNRDFAPAADAEIPWR